MNLNKLITTMLYLMKLIEKYVLRFVNQQGGSTFENWDDFMDSLTTTVPETSAVEPTV